MAKPTPLKTAAKSIVNAQGCIEKILIGSNATGKYAKIGSETRSDIAEVIAELEELKEGSVYLTESIRNLLECMAPSPAETLKARMNSVVAKKSTADVTFTDLPPVPAENGAVPATL